MPSSERLGSPPIVLTSFGGKGCTRGFDAISGVGSCLADATDLATLFGATDFITPPIALRTGPPHMYFIFVVFLKPSMLLTFLSGRSHIIN